MQGHKAQSARGGRYSDFFPSLFDTAMIRKNTARVVNTPMRPPALTAKA